ncbi:hypothetical protein [Pseudomonas graminis]|uniref:hypothetical protein n=1 Tax=Pseudomonas graminis TaxID=158627 RepID=UPI003B675C37
MSKLEVPFELKAVDDAGNFEGYPALRRDGGSEATAIVEELKDLSTLFTHHFGVSP